MATCHAQRRLARRAEARRLGVVNRERILQPPQPAERDALIDERPRDPFAQRRLAHRAETRDETCESEILLRPPLLGEPGRPLLMTALPTCSRSAGLARRAETARTASS